jgi:hypothetical protein
MKYIGTALCALIITTVGCSPAASASSAPETGSRNVASAEPPIPRPATQPCVVQLFPNQPFGEKGDGARMDAAPHRFHYQPPAKCPGPWAKVVLEADFSVAAGYQYDRSASIWLGGVNLYFGTTQEPTPEAAQSWQIQRDLTDYGSLLRRPGDGQVQVNNWLDALRRHPIHAGAKLLFYPASAAFPAPAVPNAVIALNRAANTPAKLDAAHPQLVRSITFPRNTTRVFLDLFAQPQAHDEFYYMCLPDAVIRQLGTTPPSNASIDRDTLCNGGSFREAEVSIDGQAAGLAPVAPWVFTGGIDPFLWEPTPGAQTLNFVPYRVDLTPFAGRLADGQPHQIAIKIVDTPNFFSVAGALLVYRDPHAAHTGGAVTHNTLRSNPPRATVASTLAADTDGVHGDVLTRTQQHYVIEGYVDTHAGRVQSRVETTLGFDNTQQFLGGDATGRHHVTHQAASVDSTSTTGAGSALRSQHDTIDYTLGVRTFIRSGADGIQHRDVQLAQDFRQRVVQQQGGLPLYAADTRNAYIGADRLSYRKGDRTSFASRDQSSTQTYRFTNSLGDCYQAQVQVRDGKVTAGTHGQGCLEPDAMHWFVHPDGSPDSFGWRGRVPLHLPGSSG